MDIKIITPDDRVTEVSLKDLDPVERSALVHLLGFKTTKAEGFRALQGLPLFRKIRATEVYRTCRYARRFGLKIRVQPATRPDVVAKFKALVPDAQVEVRSHILEGFCQKCQAYHAVTKLSAMVTIELQGIRMKKLYAV